MFKITFVTGSLPPIQCGVGYYSDRLLRELSNDKDLALTVITSSGTDEIPEVPSIKVPHWKLSALPSLLRKLRQTSPDIIHVQYPAVGYGRQLGINVLPYLIRLRLPKSRLVITLHEYHESRLIGKLRDFITIVPAQNIIVSNDADKNALPGWLAKRAEIIPISSSILRVPANRTVYQETMEALHLDPSKPTLLFFGFAHPNKRLAVLLDALNESALANYQVLLLTALDQSNPYHQKLLGKISALNASKTRVGCTGFLADQMVSAILQEGTYFVLPQAAPINAKSSTAITAVLHGLVLVSSGAPNPAETLPFEHAKNSYLLPDMNAASLAQAITDLDRAPQIRQSIHEGLVGLAEYFSWNSIAKKHEQLYEKLSQ